MLEVSTLACVRGERTLFEDLSFEVPDGAVLRVTGANGSGKTSLLRIVCGLTPPAEGHVCWEGRDIRTLREEYWKELVYVGHANALKDDLTALENVEVGVQLSGRGVDRGAALDALERFGIAGCAGLPARVLSQGQRRRVALARLLVGGVSRLWVLDEPFTALDAAAVRLLARLVGEHAGRGGTAVLTTHQDVTIDAPEELRIDLAAC
jgi:heme exporter protein A